MIVSTDLTPYVTKELFEHYNIAKRKFDFSGVTTHGLLVRTDAINHGKAEGKRYNK